MYGRRSTSLISNAVGAARYHAKASKKRLPPRKIEAQPKFLRTANDLVNKATDPPPGWKHTRSLRGEEKRAESKIKTVKRTARPPSAEKLAFDSMKSSYGSPVEDGEMSSEKVYEVGSIVEIRKQGLAAIAVVLAQVYVDRRLTLLCMVSSGEVWDQGPDDIVFDIPNFVTPELVERCGHTEVPADETQLQARVEVLRQLTKVMKDFENARNGISSLQLDIYSIAKSPDPDKWGSITVGEVAHLMTKQPNALTYLAAHTHLMSQPQKFLANHDYVFSQRFRVRPQVALDRIQTITNWIREPNGPIASFVKKAREIRQTNSRLLEENVLGAPSRQSGSHSWTDNDKVILLFLIDSMRHPTSLQTDPHTLGFSFICKQIMDEKEKIDDTTVQQLLTELGVIAPWQDIAELREDLGLDVDGSKMKNLQEVVNRKLGNSPSKGPLGPQDFYQLDPLEAVRHDFGDMPVYTIDDPTASELDDGLSVETIPGEANVYWLHVHVADPASVIPPSHILAKHAYDRGETVYMYHMKDHMLPPGLTHHPELGLSLGVRSPQRVLTLSAKVKTDGSLLDYKVRAGLVRNIVKTTYESVEHALGLPPTPIHFPFGDIPNPQPITTHNDFDISQFRLMKTISDSMVQKRMGNGVFNHDTWNAELFDLEIPFRVYPTLEPTTFTGSLAPKYAVTRPSERDAGAKAWVSEAMKLACRVASRFCTEHNLPILRRYATRPIAASESDFQTILDNRTSNGYVDYSITSSRLITESIAGYSTEPREHFGNGVAEGEGYVRTTSPLRRYADLLAHWQIHAALLGRPPVFSKDWMQEFSVIQKAKERLQRRLLGVHQVQWAILYLQRWQKARDAGLLKDKQDPTPKLLARTNTSPNWYSESRQWGTECSLQTLGVKATLMGIEEVTPPGTHFSVKLKDTRLGLRPQILVEMV